MAAADKRPSEFAEAGNGDKADREKQQRRIS